MSNPGPRPTHPDATDDRDSMGIALNCGTFLHGVPLPRCLPPWNDNQNQMNEPNDAPPRDH